MSSRNATRSVGALFLRQEKALRAVRGLRQRHGSIGEAVIVEEGRFHGAVERGREVWARFRKGEIHGARRKFLDGRIIPCVANVGERREIDSATVERREELAAVFIRHFRAREAAALHPGLEGIGVRRVLPHGDARLREPCDGAERIAHVVRPLDDGDLRLRHRVEGEQHLLLALRRLHHGRQEVDLAGRDICDGLRPVVVRDEFVRPARVARDLVEVQHIVAAIGAMFILVQHRAGRAVPDAHGRLHLGSGRTRGERGEEKRAQKKKHGKPMQDAR